MTSSLVGSEMCIRDRCGIPVVYQCCKYIGTSSGKEECWYMWKDVTGAVSYTHLTLPTICSV
eukprot:569302-Prorocentrum_lima.AAC.1